MNLIFQDRSPDAYWYIDYGLTIKEKNTFGYSGTDYLPSNVISPLYPAFLSILLYLDNDLEKDLKCLLKNKRNQNQPCSFDLSTIAWAQCVLAIIALWCIWLIAYLIFESNIIAWLSALITLLMGELLHYSNLVLTETMTISLFCLFSLTLTKYLKSNSLIWLVLSNISIALLTLTRPQFHYLFLFFTFLLFVLFLFRRDKHVLYRLLISILVYFTILGPWMGRNYYHFNDTALTSGYGDRVLATRVSYNRMSWQEWGVAFCLLVSRYRWTVLLNDYFL